MSTAYDLASLDMAGTTIDENELVYRVLESTVAKAADTALPAELLGRWKGTSKWEAIQGLLAGLGRPATVPEVDAVFERFSADLITAYRETPPTPMPGVLELFADLRGRGIKVTLQTGYSAPIAAAIFEGLGWSVGAGEQHTVDALVTSDLVAASRPAPYLIFHTMEATGVRRVDRVLAAGDTPNDLGAADAAGARFKVGVTSGAFTEEQLRKAPHTHILGGIAEIAALA
ncbi:phosphonatase-like hydrolase [Galactobacter valiniphilus]|uniref:phosphonatase-like hydrolase n=1 Tax=Galactobacter valiniphilus TaxID=2676122 RepID=UPI0037364D01